jgi:hypothetical protein
MTAKKILARRSVFDAAQRLQKESVAKNIRPHHLAQKRLDESLLADDDDSKRFWRDVWIHLMLIEYEPGDVQVIEDDVKESPYVVDVRRLAGKILAYSSAANAGVIRSDDGRTFYFEKSQWNDSAELLRDDEPVVFQEEKEGYAVNVAARGKKESL